MARLFDPTFLGGSALVLLALAIAALALANDDLPIVGSGVGALLLVGAIGMAGCAVGGISQAPAIGWTAPAVVLGSVLGVLALTVVGAGVLGWDSVLQPVARLVPSGAADLATARAATLALAGIIALKWIVATGLAATAR